MKFAVRQENLLPDFRTLIPPVGKSIITEQQVNQDIDYILKRLSLILFEGF